MILKRISPKANAANMFQLTEIDNMCCGDTTSVSVSTYTATVAVTVGTTKISAIRIAGTTYTFSGLYDPSEKRYRDDIEAEVKKAIVLAGYTTEGISSTYSGGNYVLVLKDSSVVFNGLNSSGNAFVASGTKTLGYTMA